MNDEATLSARLAALEQENALLRQGVEQCARMRNLWHQAIAELQTTKQQLQRSNSQLAVLLRISASVNGTLDLQRVLALGMDAMEAALDTAGGGPMAIFLVEEERLCLATCRHADEEFVATRNAMRLDSCLCVDTAREGKVVVTGDRCEGHDGGGCATADGRPRLILPLMAQNQAVGLFCCHLPAGCTIDRSQQETFQAVGQQLGMAIRHAQLFEETRALSLRDTLTGLANRRQMELVLDGELVRMRRYRRTLSVLLVDIDHFKHYNDTLGHLAGDRLLAHVGRILRRVTRESDTPARFGGEEFLVILPETPVAGARCTAERLRRTIAEETEVTVSIGVATADARQCDRDTLLQAADEALYRAKENGRNCVVG